MNKILKTILISSIAILSVCLLFTKPVQAVDFFVEFENDPLFNQANFLPGDSVTRYIKVQNNSTDLFKIATKVDNWIDDDELGDVLNLEIKQGGTSLYNKKLSDFASDGEVSLSDLASGVQTQYYYIISFDPEAGNTYQGKNLKFDILIGYQSTVQSSGGGAYAFVGGGFTTTTVPPTTTTIPGEVAGETTERELFEEGGEEGFFGITTTTATTSATMLPGLVFGESIALESSCPVNLTIAGINPLLASLLCLGQDACDTCLDPLIVLLLGLIITFGGTILAKKHHE